MQRRLAVCLCMREYKEENIFTISLIITAGIANERRAVNEHNSTHCLLKVAQAWERAKTKTHTHTHA